MDKTQEKSNQKNEDQIGKKMKKKVPRMKLRKK
jgi:hypothetical protein